MDKFWRIMGFVLIGLIGIIGITTFDVNQKEIINLKSNLQKCQEILKQSSELSYPDWSYYLTCGNESKGFLKINWGEELTDLEREDYDFIVNISKEKGLDCHYKENQLKGGSNE